MNDIAAVEARIAQLSQDAPKPVAAQPSDQSVAAFQALLQGSPYGYAAPSSPGPSPIAPAQLEALIAHASAANGEDPALVKAIVANESSFNPAATSPVGAQGLMQLMPETAREVGVTDAYDPAQNIAGGTRYLSELLQRFGGDIPSAVEAYNAGPEAVASGHTLPAETQNYVRNVMSSYEHYRTQEQIPNQLLSP